MIKSWKELEEEIGKLSKLVEQMKGINREELIEKHLELVVASRRLVKSISEKFSELFKVLDFLKTSNMNLEEIGKIEAMVKEKHGWFESVKRELETTIIEVEEG